MRNVKWIAAVTTLLLMLLAHSYAAADDTTKPAAPQSAAKEPDKSAKPDGSGAAADVVWKEHDLDRPKPSVKDPGPPTEKEFAKPPEGAVVLFDGKDLSAWVRKPGAKEVEPSTEPKWKVADGYFEVVPNSGSIYSKEKFNNCRIHLEWATPAEVNPAKKGQNRGNSGVFLPGHGELQVLESFENETYADGQAAAVYGKYPPLVNVCRKPGEWQSYDITLEMPRFDAKRKLIKPCTLTVVQNGIVVQDHVDLGGGGGGPLGLQDHYNPVRFRNIWVQKIEEAETK